MKKCLYLFGLTAISMGVFSACGSDTPETHNNWSKKPDSTDVWSKRDTLPKENKVHIYLF